MITTIEGVTGGYQSQAISEEVAQLLCELRNHREGTASANRDDVYQTINEIKAECSEPNWDGAGASAISPEAICEAALFARLLPPTIRAPIVNPTPYGAVALEWRTAGRRILLLTVAGNRQINFAVAIDKAVRHNGSLPFIQSIPEIVSLFLNSYFRA